MEVFAGFREVRDRREVFNGPGAGPQGVRFEIELCDRAAVYASREGAYERLECVAPGTPSTIRSRDHVEIALGQKVGDRHAADALQDDEVGEAVAAAVGVHLHDRVAAQGSEVDEIPDVAGNR